MSAMVKQKLKIDFSVTFPRRHEGSPPMRTTITSDELKALLRENSEVVLYCVKGGSVSQSVSDRLRRENVKACYVEGGLKAWRESGGEVSG